MDCRSKAKVLKSPKSQKTQPLSKVLPKRKNRKSRQLPRSSTLCFRASHDMKTCQDRSCTFLAHLPHHNVWNTLEPQGKTTLSSFKLFAKCFCHSSMELNKAAWIDTEKGSGNTMHHAWHVPLESGVLTGKENKTGLQRSSVKVLGSC